LEAEDLLLEGSLLALERGDLLSKTGVLGLLVSEMSLDLILHALDVRNHGLLQLLELALVVLLDVGFVVAKGLDLLALGRELLILHGDEIFEGGELALQRRT